MKRTSFFAITVVQALTIFHGRAAGMVQALMRGYRVRRMLRQSIVANSGVVRPVLSKTIEAAIESAMSPNAK